MPLISGEGNAHLRMHFCNFSTASFSGRRSSVAGGFLPLENSSSLTNLTGLIENEKLNTTQKKGVRQKKEAPQRISVARSLKAKLFGQQKMVGMPKGETHPDLVSWTFESLGVFGSWEAGKLGSWKANVK